MRLVDEALKNADERKKWEKAGVALPQFNRDEMRAKTENAPEWVHFGAGNIFRAFLAPLQQNLLEQGLAETGITAAEGFDGEIISAVFDPYDNLTLSVSLKADGSIEKWVIASVARALNLEKDGHFAELRSIFRAPSLQMASFTITEKGYTLKTNGGGFLSGVQSDLDSFPESVPVSYMGKIAALMLERYRAGAYPIALASMDNCSHNGDRLFDAVSVFADRWTEKGFLKKGEKFADYVRDKTKVSFPWSMIDKITPRPDESVQKMLEDLGFEDAEIRKTAKQTYISSFVNAEETQYLVIEDAFPNGRPRLERAGVLFTDRETVDKVEKMKVCACLNPLHTSLAVFGCLLGYKKISDEMRDRDLARLVEIIGRKEGLPALADPLVVSPQAFLDQVLRVRLPNPFMPDSPQRIACDTSQKIPIRFGETIKTYCADKNLAVEDLKLIPLTLAAWLRYLLGVDDEGKPFAVSPDPLYESLFQHVKDVQLGRADGFHEKLAPILSDSAIFGLDLYPCGLGNRVESLFAELVAGKGAVRKTLQRLLENDI
jgi:fructuronate reductase